MEIGELVYMMAYDLCCEPGALELVHHALGIVAETSCLLTMCGVPYMLWVHLAQATQPFLYLSWTLYQAGMASSAACKASTLATVALCARAAPPPHPRRRRSAAVPASGADAAPHAPSPRARPQGFCCA